MKKYFIAATLLIGSAALIISSCSKDNKSDKETSLRIRLTDNPVLAEEVNVDIQQVRIKFGEDSLSGWVNLNTYAGVYDLLGLQNGVDTLLATGTVSTDVVKEIRFVLGTNNTIKVGGVVFQLSIPSGAESGLKIKVNKQLNASLDSLLIDFDAALSIHQTGAGVYQLKPVLKIK